MLNRRQVLISFQNYIAQYDQTESMIANKKKHSYHVAENCDWIALKLGLSKEQQEIAWLIGILHDIGRFEQIKQTHAYTDDKLNHAELGVRLLFEDGLINCFMQENDYAEIIKKAVLLHNRLELPVNLTNEEFLFCNIIRDADKIDNFRGFHESDFVSFHERTLEAVQSSKITDAVMACFFEHRTIPHKVIRTDADFFLLPFALYFGIVYDCSRELVAKQGNFKKMLDFTFEDKENQRKFELIKAELTRV